MIPLYNKKMNIGNIENGFLYELVDLTHLLHSGVPTWHGRCGFQHKERLDLPDNVSDDTRNTQDTAARDETIRCASCLDSHHVPTSCVMQGCPMPPVTHDTHTTNVANTRFYVMGVAMDAGIGTHMDAPSHCIPGGAYVHDFSVQDLVMPCIVIDVSARCHANYSLSAQEIKDFEVTFGTIPARACVLVHTGWSQFWHNPLQYHNHHVFPSISKQAADFLLERDVSALGIDTLSPDRPQDGFPVHTLFLGAGKILLENVANLTGMPPHGAFVMVMPMKIQGGTEAPIRLVGLKPKLMCGPGQAEYGSR